MAASIARIPRLLAALDGKGAPDCWLCCFAGLSRMARLLSRAARQVKRALTIINEPLAPHARPMMRPLHRFTASRRKPPPREPAAPRPARPAPGGAGENQLFGASSLGVALDALEGDLRLPVEAVRHGVATASARVKAGSDAVASAAGGMEDVAAEAEAALAAAANLSGAAESLGVASGEIASDVEIAARKVAEAASSARAARALVNDLASTAEDIAGAIEAIAAVARQSNFLALNATIEAARAGPAGVEFAHLAKEMESLSLETGNAVNDIRRHLARLRENAGASAGAAEKTAAAMEDTEPAVGKVRGGVVRQHAALKDFGGRARVLSASLGQMSVKSRDLHGIVAEGADHAMAAEASAASAAALARGLGSRLVAVIRQDVMSDRRRHDRFPVRLGVALHVGAHSLATHTLDLGVGGMLLANLHAISLPAGYPLDVEIEQIGRVGARVAAVSPIGLHCAFTQLDLDAQSRLTRLIAAIEAEYRPLIAAANDAARQVETTLERAVAERRLTREQLFDSNYRPIPRTDPTQYETAYTFVLEGLLPAVLEPLLARDDRLIFCVAIDRNGYVPVHNRRYSQAQRPGETLWNATNCRHKRICGDRADLIAARSSRPFVVQSYADAYEEGGPAVHEIAVPIRALGRHWGGFRMAYRL
jgi:methyl-accepting chemotaxis protein